MDINKEKLLNEIRKQFDEEDWAEDKKNYEDNIEELIKTFSPREQTVIKLRYMLNPIEIDEKTGKERRMDTFSAIGKCIQGTRNTTSFISGTQVRDIHYRIFREIKFPRSRKCVLSGEYTAEEYLSGKPQRDKEEKQYNERLLYVNNLIKQREDSTSANADVFRDMTIEEYGFKHRIVFLLQYNYIFTINDLLKKTETDLTNIEGIGKVTINKIKESLWGNKMVLDFGYTRPLKELSEKELLKLGKQSVRCLNLMTPENKNILEDIGFFRLKDLMKVSIYDLLYTDELSTVTILELVGKLWQMGIELKKA